VLVIQASSVALEDVFCATRFQIGEHKYLLASDSLEISLLFKDWINVEWKNYGHPNLPVQIEYDIDEMLVDCSDDGIDALEEQAQQPIPYHVTREMLEYLRQDFY